MDSSIVPLAITMMAGPQILSAIIFVTSDRPIAISAAYVSAIGLTTAAWVLIWTLIASAFGDKLHEHMTKEPSTLGKVLPIVLVALLLLASLRAYLTRKTSEPPKWLAGLQRAGVAKAFALGVLLITLMPGDIVVLSTTGIHLESEGKGFVDGLPFIGLTTLIAALPLLFYLLFRRRAVEATPKAREWMNTNSWLVNIGVYAIFIVLILA